MKLPTFRPMPPAVGRWTAVLILALTAIASATPCAQAQDAGKVLKAMSDYVTSQQTISMTFDSDVEVITPELQKIQFTSSGQVLLIATAGGKRWQLPKGRVERGETPEQAAVREVREETGILGDVLAPLPGIDYWFAEGAEKRIRKHVDYFLLAYRSGSEADFDPREVDEARWFPWSEAIGRLTHANERRVAERAREVADEAGAR